MKQYRGASGKIYELEPKPIAKGGEGTVHAIKGANDIVAKIYKEEKRTRRRYEKLSLMVQYKLTELQRQQVTWPLDVIFEKEEKQFAGYIMPRLYSNEDFTTVCGSDINTINLEDRLFIAHNICAAVDTVHGFGQVCGDLNPQNICVNLDAYNSESGLMVTLVDTDSYHIVNGNMMYRCEVGQANYLPPELQKRLIEGESLSTMPLPTYSKETDRFALAVHLFSLFMNGCHPFACAMDVEEVQNNDLSVEIPQPTENILEGYSPFFSKKPGITYPAYAPDISSLPESLQKLFRRAFVDGHTDPSARPAAKEWMDVFMSILQNKDYIKCPQGHIYFIHQLECPYCAMSKRAQLLQGIPDTPPAPAEAPAAARPPHPADLSMAQRTGENGWQPQAGWQSQSQPTLNLSNTVRSKNVDQKPTIGEFIQEHVIAIIWIVIIIFLVIFFIKFNPL